MSYNHLFDIPPKTISSQGCDLAYWVHGSGPAVLFIQGVGVQGFGWLPQIEELAKHFTCIWFDNRGMALSQPMPASLSVDQMATDAQAVLTATGVANAHVIGHSLGGLVAQQMALANTTLVRSLSLICTFSGGRYVAPLGMRMIWLGMRTQIGTTRMKRHAFLRLVMPPGTIADSEKFAKDVGRLFGHDLGLQPPIVKLQLAALKACDLTGRLSSIGPIPSLVISAKYDPIAPPASGKILASKLDNARYIEFADASHGLPISHAQEVNRLLVEHLRLIGS